MKRRFLNMVIVFACLAVLTGPDSSSHAMTSAQQATHFLEPPFYGTTTVTSVFDHQFPVVNDGVINDGVRHYDNTWNGPGARSSYDEHRGIDYGLQYELVRAAAPGTVAQAGWASADHRGSYGLHVRIDHDLDHNGQIDYRTIYGHMSVLRVQTGDPIPDSGEFERILGRSGNTGWCIGEEGTGPNGRCTDNDPPTCGAHLHFQLEQQFAPGDRRPVNPYGWVGAAADPWSQYDPNGDNIIDGATSLNRWLRYPSITNDDVFPADAPLNTPPITTDEDGFITIDDGDAGFNVSPVGWSVANDPDGWHGDYHHRNTPGQGTPVYAWWSFPENAPHDWYHVFVRIPNNLNDTPANRNARADAVKYYVYHGVNASNPSARQGDIAIVNQWVYPNNYHQSPWVYIGSYYFAADGFLDTFVRVDWETANSRPGPLAADAVRFVPVVYRTYLPLMMKQWPPFPDTPMLNYIYNPNGSSSYMVTWNPADLADTYILQEATNASFSGAVTRYYGSGTSWMASGKALGTYYYRVKSRNSWGDSGWSNIQQTTVWPTVTTFHAVADTMVRSGSPTSNYGSRPSMQVGYAGSTQARRSLVRFDLSEIPSGTPIGQAKLWLYVYHSYDPLGTPRTIAAYRVTSSWVEGDVTWNTRPGFGGQYGYTSIPHNVDGWYSVDVTDLVREWVSGQYANHGVWIFGNESDPNYRSFHTLDSSTGLKPHLEITYGEGMGASSSRTGEEILPVSPLALPEAPAIPQTFQSPLAEP